MSSSSPSSSSSSSRTSSPSSPSNDGDKGVATRDGSRQNIDRDDEDGDGDGDVSRRVLTARYLEKATSKRELVGRLRTVLKILRNDESIEADSEDHPGLAALCNVLVGYIDHRDKEVRLYTVCTCMELFAIYAPDAPWSTAETLTIFKQTIRQLANLGHTTVTSQPHYYDYYRILELLAEVKIPVLLVDLYKVNDEQQRRDGGRHESHKTTTTTTNKKKRKSARKRTRTTKNDNRPSSLSSSSSDEEEEEGEDQTSPHTAHHQLNSTSQEALSVLTELFRTLLESVRKDHPPEIFDFCSKTLSCCVDEFFESTIMPIPLLDELLICVGQGPRVLVLQQPPATAASAAAAAATAAANNKKRKTMKSPPPLPKQTDGGGIPIYVQQGNPSYLVASAVIRKNVERLSTPIASLLNGLVNSDTTSRSVEESMISNLLEDRRSIAASSSTADADDGNHADDEGYNTIDPAIVESAQSIGKPQYQQQDTGSTSNVWSIIYELQKVAPSILTTVIGTLSSQVETTVDICQLVLVLETLGKMFSGNIQSSAGTDKNGVSISNNNNNNDGITNLKFAIEYSPCFRRWLKRIHHKRLEIRKLMLPHLLTLAKAFPNGAISSASSPAVELVREVQTALLHRLTNEPSAPFRMELVQGLCLLAYSHRQVLSKDLMDAIGIKVMSKHKGERKDALTGLVQSYFRQYIRYQLIGVMDGGDDCPIECVLDVLGKCCRNPPYAITVNSGRSGPAGTSKTLLSPKGKGKGRRPANKSHRRDDDDEYDDDLLTDEATGHDANDDYSYYQWIPSILFESASYKDSDDSDMRSRVIMLMDDLILGSDFPQDKKRHLTSTARATGLAIVVDGIRGQSSKAWHWMENLLATRAKLQATLKDYIDARGDIRIHVTGSEDYLAANARAMDILEKVASMIPAPSGPTPNPGERHPVLEKFHSIKDKHVFRILATITQPTHSTKARLRALDDLPKRVKATAGDAVQSWVKTLVKRCAMGNFLNQDVVHHCILLALESFQHDNWDASQRFLTCVQIATNAFPQLCASDSDFGTLSEIFRDCSSFSSSSRKKNADNSGILTSVSAILASASPYRALGKQITQVEEDLHKELVSLIRNGTPEQARHATATMVALTKPKDGLVLTKEQNQAFLPLLNNLAKPSNLAIASAGSSKNLICVLVSLAELAGHAPTIFETESRGERALKFAVDMVLLGRAHSPSKKDDNSDNEENDDSEDEESESEEAKTPCRKRSRKSADVVDHRSPSALGTSPVDDENLSISCRTLCAATDFLATYIRSTVFIKMKSKSALSTSTKELIEKVFAALTQIVRDKGIPPSSRDRKSFKVRQDFAALRQCAAITLMSLCDTRTGLDTTFLTTDRWQCLAGIFLDDESAVRASVVKELGMMLTGTGKYGPFMNQGAMAPRLRFLAFITLCVDAEHGSEYLRANGSAARLGKHAYDVKQEATSCVDHLRLIYESSAVQARAAGEEAEKVFESSTKYGIMPEYSMPYALHILATRPETPDNDSKADDKILRKRLKWLLDPLVSEDNISFLLKTIEVLSNSFKPIGGSQSKLKKVCAVSRDLLLTYIKTDSNLRTYPFETRIPSHLFTRVPVASAKVVAITATPAIDILIVDDNNTSTAATSQSTRKRTSTEEPSTFTSPPLRGRTQVPARGAHNSMGDSTPSASPAKHSTKSRESTDSRVHFSPETNFGGVSPIIGTSHSPEESKTKGSTPPSNLQSAKRTAPNSPTPVSGSTKDGSVLSPKSSDQSGRVSTGGVAKKRVRKVPQTGKENPTISKQTASRKKSVPSQIKIVRSKSPKLSMSKTQSSSIRPLRNRSSKLSKVGGGGETFDFDG